jgi:hypothetical protein
VGSSRVPSSDKTPPLEKKFTSSLTALAEGDSFVRSRSQEGIWLARDSWPNVGRPTAGPTGRRPLRTGSVGAGQGRMCRASSWPRRRDLDSGILECLPA